MEPRWITERIAIAIHEEAIARFGGAQGLRDQGLLISALNRPRQLYDYGDAPVLASMAGALCGVLVRNHPFVDGNKRSALLCARAFLFLNGHAFEPSEADEVEMLVALATGRANEEMAAEWFRRGSTPAKASPVKASPAKRLKAPPKKRKQPPRPTPRAARRT